jgi:hypothetical protein
MRSKPSQSDEHKEALESLREELDARALIHKSDVSGLLETAYSCWSPAIYKSVVTRLQLILETYDTNARRQPDAFRPYGPEALLKQGDLHLMDQMDGVPYMIDHNKLLTGVLIIGPQGSGKSRFIRHLIQELQKLGS